MINNVKVSCFYLLFGFGWQVSAFGVFFEQGTEFEAYDPENGFHEDAAAHFGCACRAVGEDDRYFGYVETVFPGFEFHFYLKCVADEFYAVQVDGAKDARAVTYEAGGGVVYRDAGYKAHVFGCEI